MLGSTIAFVLLASLFLYVLREIPRDVKRMLDTDSTLESMWVAFVLVIELSVAIRIVTDTLAILSS